MVQIFASCATFQDRAHGWQSGPTDKGTFSSVGPLCHPWASCCTSLRIGSHSNIWVRPRPRWVLRVLVVSFEKCARRARRLIVPRDQRTNITAIRQNRCFATVGWILPRTVDSEDAHRAASGAQQPARKRSARESPSWPRQQSLRQRLLKSLV